MNIPYGKQQITDADIQAVVDALQSDYLTQGPRISDFENSFAAYIGCSYAVAVSNGTAALHLAALALGVQEGDKVIATPITFAASSNCILYCEGEIVFSDIDPNTFLIDLDKVEALLAASEPGVIKGIVPVDFAGRPVDLERLRKLADKYGLWIIHDVCHAPGAGIADSAGKIQNSGNGTFAELSVFSFHPVKHIATGEGGMITTNDPKLYERLLELRTHGITRDKNKFKNTPELAGGDREYPGWYMEMQHLGYNYRLTDIQAALGSSQIKRAAANLEKRKRIARKYDAAFAGYAHVLPPQSEDNAEKTYSHAYHLYVIRADDRLGLYNFLRGKGIFCQIHYFPTHLMPYYREMGHRPGDMPNAEAYYEKCLSLPMYPSLEEPEQQFVIDSIYDFYNGKNI